MPAAEPATPAKSPPRESPAKNAILLMISAAALLVAGYFIYQQLFPPNPWQGEISEEVRETNFDAVTADQLLDMPLTNVAGEAISLRNRVGKKHLVIVITRGSLASVAASDKGFIKKEFPNICAYCSSQTSGIASRFAEFAMQDAEVLVVFPVSQPGERADAADLLKPAGNLTDSPPFPVAFDLNLQAIEQLKLRAHLARPAAFIVDRAGNLRFAYVAHHGNADRPSAGELLRHVTLINGEMPLAQDEETSPSTIADGPKKE
jgi:peroxiredoxin